MELRCGCCIWTQIQATDHGRSKCCLCNWCSTAGYERRDTMTMLYSGPLSAASPKREWSVHAIRWIWREMSDKSLEHVAFSLSRRDCKTPSTSAALSKQHCRMLQSWMLRRQSRTLLRLCCWCGSGLTGLTYVALVHGHIALTATDRVNAVIASCTRLQ